MPAFQPMGVPLTLGTAGHIDHGKTALVRALTGDDTDRLPEERARGISIELGYAALGLPSGRRLSVVDVPGHERFVRTMVAGATGIDLFLMVVAADDGVMPQTREHAAVLAALGVTRGRGGDHAAPTSPTPRGASAEAAALLPGARDRAGLRRRAARGSTRCAPRSTASPRACRGAPAPAAALRLHVDRSFTIRGAGTVVTGTLWAGSAERGARGAVLPAGRRGPRPLGAGPRRAGRARGGRPARGAEPRGRRRATRSARGDVVVAGADAPGPSFRIDAALEWATPDARPDARRARRRAPRHARDRRAARGARRPLLPAPPRARARARRAATAW